MKARKTFIEHTKNQGDKYAIGWRWTTQIIDFREYDKFNMNRANRYVGIPDERRTQMEKTVGIRVNITKVLIGY